MPAGLKYTEDQDSVLVDLVGRHLPTGGDQWIRLTAEYQIRTGVSRDEESLKERFKKLRNSKKPTGDPDCPPNIRKAKQVWREILSKMAVQDMGSPIGKSESEGIIIVAEAATDVPACNLSSQLSLSRENHDVRSELHFDLATEDDIAQTVVTSDATSASVPATVQGVSSRTGMTNDALAQLSKEIGGRIKSNAKPSNAKYTTPDNLFISETARKRQKLDRVISNLENETNSNSDVAMMILSQSQRWEQEREFKAMQWEQEKEERREDRRQAMQMFTMAMATIGNGIAAYANAVRGDSTKENKEN